jgi:hypothetical protein
MNVVRRTCEDCELKRFIIRECKLDQENKLSASDLEAKSWWSVEVLRIKTGEWRCALDLSFTRRWVIRLNFSTRHCWVFEACELVSNHGSDSITTLAVFTSISIRIKYLDLRDSNVCFQQKWIERDFTFPCKRRFRRQHPSSRSTFFVRSAGFQRSPQAFYLLHPREQRFQSSFTPTTQMECGRWKTMKPLFEYTGNLNFGKPIPCVHN